jgi:hypothetical protein
MVVARPYGRRAACGWLRPIQAGSIQQAGAGHHASSIQPAGGGGGREQRAGVGSQA